MTPHMNATTGALHMTATCKRHGTPLFPDGDCWECNGERDERTAEVAEAHAVAAYKLNRDEALANHTPRRAGQPVVCQNRTERMVTPKQLDYLKNLFADRKANADAMTLRAGLLAAYKANALTFKVASASIDLLLTWDRDTTPVAASAAPATAGVVWEKGRVYANGAGRHVRLYMNKRGGFYGKVRVDGDWEYDRDALKGIRPISSEEAAAYGKMHERCCFCAKALSDDEDGRSVDMGYGPVCAEKYGLPWGTK